MKDIYLWNDEMRPGPWASYCHRRRVFVFGVKVVIPRIRQARKLADYRGALAAVKLDLGAVSVVVGYTWDLPQVWPWNMLPVAGQESL